MRYLVIPILIISVLGFYTPVHAADTITFDTSIINGGTSQSFTVGNNANRILFVMACNFTGANPVTAVTYNSVSMTKLDGSTYSSGTGDFTTWYLLAPATGAHTLATTGGTAMNLQAYSYYNVKQSAPEAHKISTGTGQTLTSTISTVAVNALVMGSTCFNTLGTPNAVTYSTNMGNDRNPVNGTDIGSIAGNATADGGAVASPGSYAQTTTQANTITNDWNMAQISMAPSGASAATPMWNTPF